MSPSTLDDDRAGPEDDLAPYRRGRLDDELRALLGDRRSRPRVLLFGNYGNGNLGDEAILTSVLDLLRPYADVTVVLRQPDRIQRDHHVASVPMSSIGGILALARCDLIAIGGGGIFGNGMKLLTQLLPVVALAGQAIGKETCFIAIGAYTSSPLWVRQALRRVAARSALVTVRDPESAAVLDCGQRTVLVDDPALYLEPAPPAEGQAIMREAGLAPDVEVLGLSMKPTGFPDRDEKQIAVAAAAVDWWHGRSCGQAALLCLSERGDNGLGVAWSDVSMGQEVIRRVQSPRRVHLVGPDMSPAQMKSVVGQLSIVVGHRLHAQMFAWSVGTTVAGISYERKSDAFLESTGIKRFDLWAVEPSDVIDWLSTHADPPAEMAPAG